MLDITKTKNTPSPAVPQAEDGLTDEEAAARIAQDGENIIGGKKHVNPAKIFANQFHDIMVMILLGAMVLTIIIGQARDAIPIIIIVVINAILGFIQEYRAEKTLERLEELTAPTARVYRNGLLKKVPSSQIAVGDIIEIKAGDTIPCDGYIIDSYGLETNESTLSGESVSSPKRARRDEKEVCEIGLDYMLYMGTSAVKGLGLMKAVFTGKRTQMGKISSLISGTDSELTPLQKKLGELGKTLAIICIAICVIVFIAGILRGENITDMLMTSITIAVAAIPEGLPAAVTIALALAVRRMMNKKALVRGLHSVETLGCATVICTDKTGTVTQNKMTVTDIFVYSDKPCEYELDNSHYMPIQKGRASELNELLKCACICSDAKVLRTREKQDSRNRGRLQLSCEGEPTEAALALAAAAEGVFADGSGYERINVVPFDSESKKMSVTVYDGENQITYTKGAPDRVIGICTLRKENEGFAPLSQAEKDLIKKAAERYAENGLRVIMLSADYGSGNVLLGIAAMKDPLRQEAREAVLSCRRAGIKTVMITGDHMLTAKAIAKEAGIFREGDSIISGDMLNKMTDKQLEDTVENTTVYARVTPEHKLRIVRALKKRGSVCAMTGDGVNDAPAVKEASIGVAMGITGTEVTKQAADVILLDDNFATLESAVEEGRAIYRNIRKFVRFLLGCNIGEVLTTFGAIIMGMPTVLTPSQILLVNLVTDGLPAIALGVERADKDIMKKPPRKESDSFFENGLLWRVFLRGIMIAASSLMCFTVMLRIGLPLDCARTGALLTLASSQLIHVFECKSETKPFYKLDLLDNPLLILSVIISFAALALSVVIPPLQAIFGGTGLTPIHMLISLGFAALPTVLALVLKSHRWFS